VKKLYFPFTVAKQESRYFCESLFRAILPEQAAKITRPPMPSAARVRPAPAAVHNSPPVRCAPLAYANDLTPCRDGLAY